MVTYDNVLDIIDNFNTDDKIEIAEIIKKRAIEERREELKQDIKNSREELQSGKLKILSANQIIEEIKK